MTLGELFDRATSGEWNHSGDLSGHLFLLRDLASTAHQVIEIGPGAGASSIALLTGLRESDGKLWSVDLIVQPEIAQIRETCPDWEFVVGDSLASADEAPTATDLLFIDSEHTYDQTLHELSCYVPRVRAGGVVLCHDTVSHVHKVAEALDAFCASTGLTWTNDPRWNGLGRIDVP